MGGSRAGNPYIRVAVKDQRSSDEQMNYTIRLAEGYEPYGELQSIEATGCHIYILTENQG